MVICLTPLNLFFIFGVIICETSVLFPLKLVGWLNIALRLISSPMAISRWMMIMMRYFKRPNKLLVTNEADFDDLGVDYTVF